MIVPEHESENNHVELDAFLDVVLQSRPFLILKEFLITKKHPIVEDDQIFRAWIYQLWFGIYSRSGGIKGSSGFEHIFIGEVCTIGQEYIIWRSISQTNLIIKDLLLNEIIFLEP